MKSLQEYCVNELIIDGLKTYVISPEHYENILHDTKLFEQLSMSGVAKKFIPRMIEHAKQISEIEIHLAFVQHENRKVLIWEPVNVCKYGNGFYHIFIRDKALLIHSQEITENITRYPKKDCDGLFSLQNGQIQEIGIPAGGLPKQRYPLSGPCFQQAEFYYSIDLTNMKVLLIYEFGPRWSRCLEYQLIDEGDDTYTLGEVKVKWVS